MTGRRLNVARLSRFDRCSKCEWNQRHQKELKHDRLKCCGGAASGRCEHERRNENSKKYDQCLGYWAPGEKRHPKESPHCTKLGRRLTVSAQESTELGSE